MAIDRRYGNQLLEFWRDEGAQTAVSVRASQFQHVLYLDGLHQANDQPAMVLLHRAIGHLPMVLHGAPKDVLVVGMGGGATPGAVSQYAGARVQVVELSDSVRKAAPFFAHVNYDLLEPPERRHSHRRRPQFPGADRPAHSTSSPRTSSSPVTPAPATSTRRSTSRWCATRSRTMVWCCSGSVIARSSNTR